MNELCHKTSNITRLYYTSHLCKSTLCKVRLKDDTAKFISGGKLFHTLLIRFAKLYKHCYSTCTHDPCYAPAPNRRGH